ncbi:MAG: endonuclease NucS domain-containing protein [Nanoarchaeota archaeon]
MLMEKDFEDILTKYPELIEENLTLEGRQVTVHGRRMDLLFKDTNGRQLIVELKVGPILDKHIGQILSYEGMLLAADDPTIRVMLIGNRVAPNLRKVLDHHGIAWKEISNEVLRKFIKQLHDEEFEPLFKDTPEGSSHSARSGRQFQTSVPVLARDSSSGASVAGADPDLSALFSIFRNVSANILDFVVACHGVLNQYSPNLRQKTTHERTASHWWYVVEFKGEILKLIEMKPAKPNVFRIVFKFKRDDIPFALSQFKETENLKSGLDINYGTYIIFFPFGYKRLNELPRDRALEILRNLAKLSYASVVGKELV